MESSLGCWMGSEGSPRWGVGWEVKGLLAGVLDGK